MTNLNAERRGIDPINTNRMMKNLVLYIHGKGGNTVEGDCYKKFFPDSEVYGFDYKSKTPWEAKVEFYEKVSGLSKEYGSLTLIVESLGAYFSLVSGIEKFISKAYFISPIVNMERLILDMIRWAGTSETEPGEKKIIPVDFGDDLSWEYLQYVRQNKIQWKIPAEILYGSLDNLQSFETIRQFAKESGAGVTNVIIVHTSLKKLKH